jgi:transposase InsO family protein
MKQMDRSVTQAGDGFLSGYRYLLHDRDTKGSAAFCEILRLAGIQPIALPPRSPNLNSHWDRWNRSVKKECISKLTLPGEASLRNFLSHYAHNITPGGAAKVRAL